ncbi:MAG: sugar phosphate isomerase/epimerase family protein [Candidatus Nanosalina sp.]
MTEIGMGTGCFYRLDMSQNQRIRYISELGADGVEVTLSEPEELDELDWSQIKDLTDSFRFVTIHSPIKKDFRDKEEDRALLKRLEEFRERIGAETVVFHPDRVEGIELLRNVQASVENMQKRKDFDRHDLDEFLEKDFPVVIDTVHADTWEKEEYPDEKQYLFEKYSGRINHVHASVNGPEEEHEPFCRYPKRLESQRELLEGRKVILESKFSSREQAEEEIRLLKEKL